MRTSNRVAANRRLRLFSLLGGLGIVLCLAQPVAAQSDGAPTTTVPSGAVSSGPETTAPLPLPDTERNSIIPIPNSGPGPQNEGDPGTASQYLVMAGTFGGLLVILALIVRESRKKLALAAATGSATADGPQGR